VLWQAKRFDDSTRQRTDKKGEQVVQTMTRKMGSDDKSFTVTAKGANDRESPSAMSRASRRPSPKRLKLCGGGGGRGSV
jgi:hypothetical protein